MRSLCVCGEILDRFRKKLEEAKGPDVVLHGQRRGSVSMSLGVCID